MDVGIRDVRMPLIRASWTGVTDGRNRVASDLLGTGQILFESKMSSWDNGPLDDQISVYMSASLSFLYGAGKRPGS